MTEWRPVVDYEDRYRVSDDGQVQSLLKGGRLLTPFLARKGGYLRVSLTRDNKSVGRFIHKLVTEAFLGPCPEGLEVRHGPGGKFDNSISNLSYGTHVENILDKHRDGTWLTGSRLYNAKLTEDAVVDMRLRRADGFTYQELADKYGVSMELVFNAVTGRTWKHVEQPIPERLPHRRAMAKLNVNDVREIRRRHQAGESQAKLSREYKVSQPTISDAITGRTWKNVPWGGER